MKPLSRLLAAAVCAGLFSTLCAAPQKAPVLPLPGEVPGSETILLGVDTVRKELGVNSLQRALLDSLRSDYRDESREIVAKAGDSEGSKAAAQRKLDALTDSYDRRALKVLNTQQRQRLTEVEHQILGGYMLLSPALQKTLGLSKEQKDKLTVIWNKDRKYVSKINGRYERGEVGYAEKMRALYENRQDRSDDMLDVLTDAQHAQFDKLAGEKFLG